MGRLGENHIELPVGFVLFAEDLLQSGRAAQSRYASQAQALVGGEETGQKVGLPVPEADNGCYLPCADGRLGARLDGSSHDARNIDAELESDLLVVVDPRLEIDLDPGVLVCVIGQRYEVGAADAARRLKARVRDWHLVSHVDRHLLPLRDPHLRLGEHLGVALGL